MKVLIVTPFLSKNGLGRVAANLSTVLSKFCEVTVLCQYDTPDKFKFTAEYFYFKDIKERRRVDIFPFGFFLMKFSMSREFDVVISLGAAIDIINCFSGLFNKNKVVTTLHNNFDLKYNVLYRNFLPLTVFLSDHVITVSKELTKRLRQKVKLPFLQRKVSTIYNPVSVESSCSDLPASCSSKQEYFISIGRLDDEKAFWHVIGAANLSKKDYVFYIFGEGSNRKTLQDLIDKHNLNSKVFLMGYSSHVNSYLKNAKGLILSSLCEGLPMVIIESMMYKVPVFSVDCISGPKELLLYSNKFDSKPGVLFSNKASSFHLYNEIPFSEHPLDREISEVIDNLNEQSLLKMRGACSDISNSFCFDAIGLKWKELIFE